MPDDDEGDAFALLHRELRARRQIDAACFDRRPERQRVRTANRAERAVLFPHPRHDRSVVEADHQLHLHPDLAVDAFDDPDQIGLALTGRHAVDHSNGARVRGEVRFEHERMIAIPPRARPRFLDRSDQPSTVRTIAEQSGEARRRIESRQAQPVDRSIEADERCCLRVSNQPVVFNFHTSLGGAPLVSPPRCALGPPLSRRFPPALACGRRRCSLFEMGMAESNAIATVETGRIAGEDVWPIPHERARVKSSTSWKRSARHEHPRHHYQRAGRCGRAPPRIATRPRRRSDGRRTLGRDAGACRRASTQHAESRRPHAAVAGAGDGTASELSRRSVAPWRSLDGYGWQRHPRPSPRGQRRQPRPGGQRGRADGCERGGHQAAAADCGRDVDGRRRAALQASLSRQEFRRRAAASRRCWDRCSTAIATGRWWTM